MISDKKHWTVIKTYICTIKGEICGNAVCNYNESNAPECDGSAIMAVWKRSGLTKKEFQKVYAEALE